MDSTGIYENLPLRVPSDLSENLQNGNTEITHPVSPVSTTAPTSASGPDGLSLTKKSAKKRKSTSEIPKTSSTNFQSFLSKIKPKSSRGSSFEMCDRKKKVKDEKKMGEEEKMDVTEEQRNDEDLDKDGEASEEIQLTQKYVNTHSTPTSGFDDGYGSCNSSPHGSGESNFFSKFV